MRTNLDHLVIGAQTLAQGRQYVKEQLGVEIPLGGRHPRMGTHNCLAKLDDAVFLEIIAIDPEGEQPLQPRWFGLDDPLVRRRLADGPGLLTWVVNTDNITGALNIAEISFGAPQPLSRGDLRWYFGVPDDGRLLAGGMLPYIISWQTDEHPAAKMADLGCRLQALRLFTPFVEWTARQLEDIGALNLIEIQILPEMSTPYLEAEISTKSGSCLLKSI